MISNLKTFADYLYLAKKRKYYILITWLLVSVISVIAAYFIPKTYRSTATMLIEAPLPTKLFESTVSQYADEQIQSVYQRVMTTDNVFSIIELNGLYDDIKNDYTRHELADFFRDSAEIELAASSLTPKANSGMAEIAFNISFSDSDATTAKEIVSSLVTLFIEQNDKSRTQRVIKATDFLMEESSKLNRELQEIDNKIVKYKEQNNFSLPEQAEGNFAAIDRTENELRDTDSQIRAAKERIAFLASELARAQEIMPGKLDDKAPQSKDEALRMLRIQYLQLSSIYSPSHPSITRLKREIKTLDPTFEGQPSEKGVLKQLPGSASNLQMENQNTNRQNTNPAYLGVEAQFKSSQSELQSLVQKQDYLKAKLEKMQNLLSLAPQVEKGYNDLIRERDNTTKKYTQLKEKWLDAKLLQTQEQQGQTLTIIEQPVIPTHPEKAIRRKVAIGGFFLGLFAGIGLAFVLEFMDQRLVGYRAIAEATGLMPIVVIPYIETPSEEKNKLSDQQKEKKIAVWIIGVCICLVTIIAFYFFYPYPITH